MNGTLELLQQLMEERRMREQGVQQAGRGLTQAMGQPAGGAIRNPGQSLGDLFTNPSPEQNNALLQMSLQMMGHDPTKMPGQTLAKAVGGATDAMSAFRTDERDRAIQAAQAQYDMAQDRLGEAGSGIRDMTQAAHAFNDAGGRETDIIETPEGQQLIDIATGEVIETYGPGPDQMEARREQAAAEEEERRRRQQIATSQLKGAETNIQEADVVLDRVDKAIAQAQKWFATGAAGQMTKDWGHPFPASNLDANLSTIRGNIGFERLQRMREESPTGGALGQVSVKELDQLNDILGSLSLKQGDEQLIQNLEDIRKIYTKILNEAKNFLASSGQGPRRLPERFGADFMDRLNAAFQEDY